MYLNRTINALPEPCTYFCGICAVLFHNDYIKFERGELIVNVTRFNGEDNIFPVFF